MPRFGSAGARWAQARNAHCSSWAQNFNRNFPLFASARFVSNTCEYVPMAQLSERGFPGQSCTGDAVRMLADAEATGLAVAADDEVVAFLSGTQSLLNDTMKDSKSCFWKLDDHRREYR